MRTAALAFLVSLGLWAQDPAPAPKGADKEAWAEVERANRAGGGTTGKAHTYLAGEPAEALVYFDPAMRWGMQAKMYGAAARKTYLAHGITTLFVSNGEKAWKKDLVNDGPTEEVKVDQVPQTPAKNPFPAS